MLSPFPPLSQLLLLLLLQNNQTGKYHEALKYSQRAAYLKPTDPMVHRNIAKLQNVLGNSFEAAKNNRIAIRLGPGIHARSDPGDYNAYRALSMQLVSIGQRESGHACDHYDAYRALAGKRKMLALSQKTRELLMRTNTKA